jgi:hypothetical protein
MKRMVCVFLSRFLTGRLERLTSAAARRETRAVSVTGKGGNRLIAVDAAARLGLREGMLLTDATAIEPSLRAVPRDTAGAAAGLKRLATWCRRYAPSTGIDRGYGLQIDASGAAHLLGGEKRLLADLKTRFEKDGFGVRAVIASTHGAAWALTRFGGIPLRICKSGEERRGLSPLPVRALGIAEDTAALLDALGLKTIGQIMDIPRDSLRARFERPYRPADGAAGYGRGAPFYDPRHAYPGAGVDHRAGVVGTGVRHSGHGGLAPAPDLAAAGRNRCHGRTARLSAAPLHLAARVVSGGQDGRAGAHRRQMVAGGRGERTPA